MRNNKLTEKYLEVVDNKKTLKESPQTAPAPVKPGTKPTTTPGKPSTTPAPRPPGFPAPGQSPRPKAVMAEEEDHCEYCGEPMSKCDCPEHADKKLETENGNPALKRFIAKRSRYTQ